MQNNGRKTLDVLFVFENFRSFFFKDRSLIVSNTKSVEQARVDKMKFSRSHFVSF